MFSYVNTQNTINQKKTKEKKKERMETWFIFLISLSLCFLLKSLLTLLKPTQNLPPGPPTTPIITGLVFILKPLSEIESILCNLRDKYGPIITLRVGSRPAIFIADHSLAHEALVRNGAVFADRPLPPPTSKVSTFIDIGSSSYGPTWRLLRRNLTSKILHPSRVKSYSQARKWVLDILINRIKSGSSNSSISKSGDQPVLVKDHFQYAMFCLLVLMCFGDKLDESKIKEVEEVQRKLLLSHGRFSVLNFWPRLTRILFWKLWEELRQLSGEKDKVLIPLIRARKSAKKELLSKHEQDRVVDHDHEKAEQKEFVVSYVDSLLDLELPEQKRKLEEKEIVTLCSEFLDAGTDTTSTTLQWIMANLVKNSDIQEKLFTEIKGVMEGGQEEVKEEDIQKMPYLKAVILEGLRLHPPGHFVVPHVVREDTVLNGFMIPKNGTVNFMVAEMGKDEKVWEEARQFKPERFLKGLEAGEVFDITGSREIKMMPFGVGRRICPGFGLAILHLEYFVANLVWNFKWIGVDGDEIDMAEIQEFAVVMKNPLKARISTRRT